MYKYKTYLLKIKSYTNMQHAYFLLKTYFIFVLNFMLIIQTLRMGYDFRIQEFPLDPPMYYV